MSKQHTPNIAALEGTLGVNDAAARYDVHPATIRRWVKSGRLGALRVGGKLLKFTPEHFQQFDDASIVDLTAV